MVWDKELGFISREDLKAMGEWNATRGVCLPMLMQLLCSTEPQQPIARNEAERVLNFLEGMRTPLGDARTSQPPIVSALSLSPQPHPSDVLTRQPHRRQGI